MGDCRIPATWSAGGADKLHEQPHRIATATGGQMLRELGAIFRPSLAVNRADNESGRIEFAARRLRPARAVSGRQAARRELR